MVEAMVTRRLGAVSVVTADIDLVFGLFIPADVRYHHRVQELQAAAGWTWFYLQSAAQ